MSDLISRQKTLEKFEPWLKVKDYSEGELNMLKAVLYEIRMMPSAQKTGQWIDTTKIKGFPESTCSACGSSEGMYWMNYCPHCGAKMEE